MATLELPPDFSEFLKLLRSNGVKYLLIGRYAVGHYGYSRPTGDMDVWIERDPENARRLVTALTEFGFGSPGLTPELILDPKRMLRMGVPPLLLEILTTISGVDFADCYPRRFVDTISGVEVDLINRDDLKKKRRRAAGSRISTIYSTSIDPTPNISPVGWIATQPTQTATVPRNVPLQSPETKKSGRLGRDPADGMRRRGQSRLGRDPAYRIYRTGL